MYWTVCMFVYAHAHLHLYNEYIVDSVISNTFTSFFLFFTPCHTLYPTDLLYCFPGRLLARLILCKSC